MRLCKATRRTVVSISVLYFKAQPYVAYFHWYRSDMSLFLTLARIVVPAVAGAAMASVGFILSVLGAIAQGFVSAFLALPPEEQRLRVEPKLLTPTLHSRNASTASLYSVALSHDSDSIGRTTSETASSKQQAKILAEDKGRILDVPPSPSPPISRSSSQQVASGSNLLQLSKEAIIRSRSPVRRIACQIQEDCRIRRATRKSTSPPSISVALPSPLTPIPSADPSTPSLSEQQSLASHSSGAESSRPKVNRSVTSPTTSSMSSSPHSSLYPPSADIPHAASSQKKKWLPRRQHSTPPQRPPPLPRTDPYQAPYFFPTPLSPDAADYVRQVRISRSSVATGGTVFEQRRACEPGPIVVGGHRARSRETSIDGRLDSIGEGAAVRVVGEGEKEGRNEAQRKQAQAPTRRLSWHPVTEEPASMSQEERPSASRSPSGSDSAPNSPTSFLRKSRSLLRPPQPLAFSSFTSEAASSSKGRSRSGPSPSPDTREGSGPRTRKKFSLLEKIHHRRSYSGDKAT
ncbi:uncharacterized protein B0H18DRAFT_1001341 [Fomitopsis serialis]|uniref:uncharacterized protein n=1 Tax=Fomitopsis serialis TaxID=139415 RepID=UPI00200756A2|nr:uncharacterized protein B0H18DRAFT_1001341 [Neoantrodia serialis]KAH9928088.1 hypothetical protein B0H18DRAFT_1001341 [Neoantrodia serialis]